MFCLFFPFTPVFTISSELKKKKKFIETIIKMWQENLRKKNPQTYKQIIWDLATLLHFNNEFKNTKKKTNDKNVLTSVNIITLLPFSQVTMFSPTFPFHRSFCHMTAFLKLGLFDATKFYFISRGS